jgi:nitrite reductase/ring-hydroxylating ferredoxin subunit
VGQIHLFYFQYFFLNRMEWVKVFRSQEEARQRIPPGKPQLVVLHDIRICLVLRGEIFLAVQDKCTHNGTSLSTGFLNYLGQIICPLHNYCFDLQTGREMANRSFDLRTFPLKIDDSGFFVGI